MSRLLLVSDSISGVFKGFSGAFLEHITGVSGAYQMDYDDFNGIIPLIPFLNPKNIPKGLQTSWFRRSQEVSVGFKVVLLGVVV